MQSPQPAGVRIDDREGPLRLRDGRTVLVRAVGPDDHAVVAALYAGLSPHSLAMRFGAGRRGLSDDEVRALVGAPGPDGLGLVSLAGGEAERAIALARYDRTSGASEAELSIAVADDWQGLGLGTDLLEVLLARAAEDGIDALWGIVRPDNLRMLMVFRALGCEERELRQRGEVLVRLETPPDEGLDEAAAARFMDTTITSLLPMLRPTSIAVVGASRNPAAPGGAVFRALRDGGFAGPVFAVNRSADAIDGQVAYPSLGALPRSVDLVVVVVPATDVPAVARQAAANGARALAVLSSGFSEAGEDGAALEAELLHVARTSGMRVLGPNCLGLSVTDPTAAFNATFGPGAPPDGSIALASQSGGLGIGALALCRRRGIGLSAFVSMGNMADISPVDLLAWWAKDRQTQAVLLYLEGLTDPRRFARVARSVARSTPIVALKAGRGRAGLRAAGSHTAALAAGEAPTDALFALAGVVRVDTIEELFDAGELMVSQPLPAGERIAIITNAGGLGVVTADACEAAHLAVPQLSQGVADRLVSLGAVSATNPVDMGSTMDAGAMEAVGSAIAVSGEVDVMLVVDAPVAGGDPVAIAHGVDRLAANGLPVVGCLLGEEVIARRMGLRVPWFDFPEAASRAIACAVRAGAARDRAPDPVPELPGCDRRRARLALEQAPAGAWLEPEQVEELLSAYGVAVPRSRVVHTADAAAEAQRAFGLPVAVKLVSRTVIHKSDVGGVILDCDSPDATAAAFRRIAGRVGADPSDAVVVQEMAPRGVDLIVGAVHDPLFGPLVLAGIGGTEAEVWRDRMVALAPVGRQTAHEMWDGLRGLPLIKGWRGSPGADRAGLEECLLRVAQLAAEQPLLAELDLNPVRSSGPGQGVVVLDARARRR